MSQYQVKGQRLTLALEPIGSMFTVGTAGQYDVTEVASDGDGFFVVAAGDDVSGSAAGLASLTPARFSIPAGSPFQ